MTTLQLKDAISKITDGPITAFILMKRSADLVRAGQDAERCANALWEVMYDCGFLSETGQLTDVDV